MNLLLYLDCSSVYIDTKTNTNYKNAEAVMEITKTLESKLIADDPEIENKVYFM